jgi:hypothetical protein
VLRKTLWNKKSSFHHNCQDKDISASKLWLFLGWLRKKQKGEEVDDFSFFEFDLSRLLDKRIGWILEKLSWRKKWEREGKLEKDWEINKDKDDDTAEKVWFIYESSSEKKIEELYRQMFEELEQYKGLLKERNN